MWITAISFESDGNIVSDREKIFDPRTGEMEMALFNVNDGFAEAVVRGFRSAYLTTDDYRRISAGDNLEDVRTALDETDYGEFVQDEPSPLLPTSIVARCREKLANDFKYVRTQVSGDLGTFLDYIRYEKMIDNIVMIIQGTINNKPPRELLARVDPLGWFEELRTIPTMDYTHGYDDLYRTILIDTPIAPYFREFLETVSNHQSQSRLQDVTAILTETDLEIMRNILKKAWLEDFYSFCTEKLSGTATAEIMGDLLQTEADFRVLSVTLNALNSPLGSSQQISDRNALYPSFGKLYPDGTNRIRRAWNEQTVRAALEPFEKFAALYEQCKQFYDKDSLAAIDHGKGRFKSIEDLLFAELEKQYEMCFENQFHYGVFYAWIKLQEQELRNLEWICNMIQMGRKQDVDDIIPLFPKRY
jgi:V-type H+-transporting ATPase subunit d